MNDLAEKLAAERAVLSGVVKRGACWYQRSMSNGTKLGEPTLVVITSKNVDLCAEGLCIDEDGTTYLQNVYADGVLSRPVTPAEVEARIKLAVQHCEQNLRRTCHHLLPHVLQKTQGRRMKKTDAA